MVKLHKNMRGFYMSKLIKNMTDDYFDYLHDESRVYGNADSISFPQSEAEIQQIVAELYPNGTRITVQGGRTGLSAGAVPDGGHIMNLSRMNKIISMSKNEKKDFTVRVEPGVVLTNLRKAIADKKIDITNFSAESKKHYIEFENAPEQFFPTDPTEATATIGGIVACNASGACSYKYGSAREHVEALRVVLSDGQTLSLSRGEYIANGRELTLTTEQGEDITVLLPAYTMPNTKNASGYYIKDDMDAVDLFIGSDGSLGIISEIELKLLPLPEAIWNVNCFTENEEQALNLVIALREQADKIAALEFFDSDALQILRQQKKESTAFSGLPDIDANYHSAVYIELHCENEEEAVNALFEIENIMKSVGINPDNTWVATTASDKDRLHFLRHAVPEAVNMLIDKRKKENPEITKLGTDMSVPNAELKDMMSVYRTMLKEYGLQSAIWGHIGDNHVHVNILPRNGEEYQKGKELYGAWAKIATEKGGAVSAEHGVGKIKSAYLETMYGKDNIISMAKTKATLDEKALLGSGNMFDADLVLQNSEVVNI